MSVIEVSNLSKRYGDKLVVNDVSLSVEKDEIFGILGPNGAGKTTFVECMAGLRRPTGGSVRILGLDPMEQRRDVKLQMGMQLQHGELPDKLRVHEAVSMYASFYPNPADGDKLLRELGLEDKRNTPYKNLSGGQQQRLAIALALIGQPKVAVLDELTTGLDPQARRDTWSMIERVRSTGVSIVLVTHFMDEAERLCDRLAVIKQGELLTVDTPAGFVSSVTSTQQMTFRPSAPFDDRVLTKLSEVAKVDHKGSEVIVTGSENLVQAVCVELHHNDVVTEQLKVQQSSLEDAFISIAGQESALEV